DGIRDFHVTGVQTCALPISTTMTGVGHVRRSVPSRSTISNEEARDENDANPSRTLARLRACPRGGMQEHPGEPSGFQAFRRRQRSEERREGTEGGYRKPQCA